MVRSCSVGVGEGKAACEAALGGLHVSKLGQTKQDRVALETRRQSVWQRGVGEGVGGSKLGETKQDRLALDTSLQSIFAT